MTHLTTFDEKYAGRFLEVVQPLRVVVYGSPSAAVKAALADLSPLYLEPAAGFSR
jgi:hypothetical protein